MIGRNLKHRVFLIVALVVGTAYLAVRDILLVDNMVTVDKDNMVAIDRFDTESKPITKFELSYDESIVSKVNQYEMDLKTRHLYVNNEGYSAQWPFEVEFYHKTVVDTASKLLSINANKPIVVCETGLNMGHSAFVFLASHENVRYIGFDLGLTRIVPHQAEIVKFLKSQFSTVENPNRFELIVGDSTKTLANVEQIKTTMKKLFNQDYCDIVSVDGGHVGDVPLIDLINFQSYSYHKSYTDSTFILIDDCMCSAGWCEPVSRGWKEAQKIGIVTEIGYNVRNDGERGLCWGHYLPPSQ